MRNPKHHEIGPVYEKSDQTMCSECSELENWEVRQWCSTRDNRVHFSLFSIGTSHSTYILACRVQ